MIYFDGKLYNGLDELSQYLRLNAINIIKGAEKVDKDKRIGDYTLFEIREQCPYVHHPEWWESEDFSDYCQTCNFNNICATVPNETTMEQLEKPAKKRLTDKERKDIEAQISKLQQML